MNNREITRVLAQHPTARRVFRGVYPRDRLPRHRLSKNHHHAFVINTAPAGHRGEHWVGVWLDARTRIAEYFDSYGLPPRHHDIQDFLLKNCTYYKYNDHVLQDALSSTCGLYVMYFIIRKSYGDSLPRALSIFSANSPATNDRKVIQKFRRQFGTGLNQFV